MSTRVQIIKPVKYHHQGRDFIIYADETVYIPGPRGHRRVKPKRLERAIVQAMLAEVNEKVDRLEYITYGGAQPDGDAGTEES